MARIQGPANTGITNEPERRALQREEGDAPQRVEFELQIEQRHCIDAGPGKAAGEHTPGGGHHRDIEDRPDRAESQSGGVEKRAFQFLNTRHARRRRGSRPIPPCDEKRAGWAAASRTHREGGFLPGEIPRPGCFSLSPDTCTAAPFGVPGPDRRSPAFRPSRMTVYKSAARKSASASRSVLL